MGLFAGLLVMIWSFGPAIFLLFLQESRLLGIVLLKLIMFDSTAASDVQTHGEDPEG